MAQLKGVIFSLRDVLARPGAIDRALFDETLHLIRFLIARGVTPVFASNHDWTVNTSDGVVGFREWIEATVGKVPYFVAERGEMDWKPRAGAVGRILKAQGWSPREVLYVGNSDDDMRTARNGGVLFLNALWHGEANPYGFQFQSPRDIARYIDCICLGLDKWFWTVERPGLRAYSMGPFTTLSPALAQAHAYSADARAASKLGIGDVSFWGRLLAARVYFSGLVDEISYITSYPGHAPDSKDPVVADALSILAESLHKKYLPDLIIRHSKASKSQTARIAGAAVGVENQLSTILLNRRPRKGLNGQPYVNNPLGRGKTVLVVDDICTQGNSFEAARAFLQKTGTGVICLSWLKTINTDYRMIQGDAQRFIADAYAPVTPPGVVPVTALSYGMNVTNPGSASDLAQVHARYAGWSWPA